MAEKPNPASPKEVISLFRRYGLQPSRRLGQNFLIDANIVRKVVAAAEIKRNDAVIEVGPGAGALTVALAETGADLLVLEIDHGLIQLLRDLLRPWPAVKVCHADVLKVSWSRLNAGFGPGRAVKLISNLPYNISGPFVYDLLKENFPFSAAVLMFQKEVAGRLVAGPEDEEYGGLSVLCRYYTRSEKLFDVSRNVFWPRPNVDSTVVRLRPRERELPVKVEPLFWQFVQGAFQQRRKTLLNNMIRLYPLTRNTLEEILEEAEIDPVARPEELRPEQFAKLTLITYNYLSK